MSAAQRYRDEHEQRRHYATVDVPSGWTVETLKMHFDELRAIKRDHERELSSERELRYAQKDDAVTDRFERALTSNEKALTLIAEQQKEYKVASNEWRGTLNDLVTRMMTRHEVEGTLTSINEKLDTTFGAINTKIDRQHTELLTQITQLRDVNLKDSGKDEGLEIAKKNNKYIITLALAMPPFIIAVVGIATLLMRR